MYSCKNFFTKHLKTSVTFYQFYTLIDTIGSFCGHTGISFTKLSVLTYSTGFFIPFVSLSLHGNIAPQLLRSKGLPFHIDFLPGHGIYSFQYQLLGEHTVPCCHLSTGTIQALKQYFHHFTSMLSNACQMSCYWSTFVSLLGRSYHFDVVNIIRILLKISTSTSCHFH